MNPKYCVSLETAKRMKGLGFPQNTDFYWSYWKGKEKNIVHLVCPKFSPIGDDFKHFVDWEWCSAPHCGELGEWLPKKIIANVSIIKNVTPNETSFALRIKPIRNGWRIAYYRKTKKPSARTGKVEKWLLTETQCDSEAEARAKMLIYLAENKLIDPKTL